VSVTFDALYLYGQVLKNYTAHIKLGLRVIRICPMFQACAYKNSLVQKTTLLMTLVWSGVAGKWENV